MSEHEPFSKEYSQSFLSTNSKTSPIENEHEFVNKNDESVFTTEKLGIAKPRLIEFIGKISND